MPLKLTRSNDILICHTDEDSGSKNIKKYNGWKPDQDIHNYGMMGIVDETEKMLHMVCMQTYESFCEPIPVNDVDDAQEIQQLAHQANRTINRLN
jgi:hypothetical protein